jgi:hypothetical protein
MVSNRFQISAEFNFSQSLPLCNNFHCCRHCDPMADGSDNRNLNTSGILVPQLALSIFRAATAAHNTQAARPPTVPVRNATGSSCPQARPEAGMQAPEDRSGRGCGRPSPAHFCRSVRHAGAGTWSGLRCRADGIRRGILISSPRRRHRRPSSHIFSTWPAIAAAILRSTTLTSFGLAKNRWIGRRKTRSHESLAAAVLSPTPRRDGAASRDG